MTDEVAGGPPLSEREPSKRPWSAPTIETRALAVSGASRIGLSSSEEIDEGTGVGTVTPSPARSSSAIPSGSSVACSGSPQPDQDSSVRHASSMSKP